MIRLPAETTRSRRLGRERTGVLFPELADTTAHVHRFQAEEKERISSFLANDNRNSALICGDTERVLSCLPECLFQTCVTSPPYWSLRDYNIPGQIGLEDSVVDYIDHLVSVFAEVRRVMRNDGTLWLNIGDSYTSGGRTWQATDNKELNAQ